MIIYEKDFLAHYGVKGMKWGVRKDRTARKISSDYKKTADLRNKDPRTLSNKQLKALNERLNLEQNYRRLNPTSMERGQARVKAILSIAGLGAGVYNTVNSPAYKKIGEMLKNKG